MDKTIKMLGIDIAKSKFQLHGINSRDQCILKRCFTRKKMMDFTANLNPCIIVMEACAGSNYLARTFSKSGHEVKLIAPQYVKPFVKGNKDDAADAEAITEAAIRPNMNFVAIKQVWQQELQMVHRVRSRLMKNRTALMNEIRGLLGEFGTVVPQGQPALIMVIQELLAREEQQLSYKGIEVFQELYSELIALNDKIKTYDNKLKIYFDQDPVSQRLSEVSGLGLITTTALSIALCDPSVFKNGRQFAAWLGLVPKHTGTGGKNMNLGISKRGDRYLRTLLVHGARSVVASVKRKNERGEKLSSLDLWISKLEAVKGYNKAAVALANKNARIAWSMIAHNQQYDFKLASGY